MADVRLTATNPEDSSVVPVACNEKGELKIEEPLGFDGTLDGDLTVNGSATFSGDVTTTGTAFTSSRRVRAPSAWSAESDNSGAFDLDLQQGLRLKSNLDTFPYSIRVWNSNSVSGSSDPNVSITADGSATFSGDVTSGALISNGDVTLAGNLDVSDGRLTLDNKGQLDIYRPGGDGAGSLLLGYGNIEGDEKVLVAKLSSHGKLFLGNTRSAEGNPLNNSTSRILIDGVSGAGRFNGNVSVTSRGTLWNLVESGGLCHMVAASQLDADDGDSASSIQEYPNLRDVFKELDMVELALQQVMERLKMTPPSGWEVWDGSDI